MISKLRKLCEDNARFRSVYVPILKKASSGEIRDLERRGTVTIWKWLSRHKILDKIPNRNTFLRKFRIEAVPVRTLPNEIYLYLVSTPFGHEFYPKTIPFALVSLNGKEDPSLDVGRFSGEPHIVEKAVEKLMDEHYSLFLKDPANQDLL